MRVTDDVDIGGWSRVEKDRIQPYHAIKVWDGVSGSSIDFDPIDAANNALSSVIPGRKHTASYTNGMASMIENSNLTNALYQHVRGGDHVEILSNTRVEQIHLGEEDSEIDLRSWPVLSLSGTQRRFAARLLVGADGANSPVRSFSEITSRGWDYDRHGVVATLRMSDVSTGPRTAYQRFLPTGPIALLPLPGDYASLVWSTTPDRAAMLKSLGTSDFVAMVNAAFRLLPVDIDYMHKMHSGQSEELAWRCSSTMTKSGQTPADIESVQEGSVASFPLRMRHTDTYVGERVALIGDAAHSIHPLAGQGLNQGLGDAQGLAKQIQHAVSVGRDIGSSFVLDEYNATQWARNNAMLGTVDKLHKLYSASSGPVVWARSLGLDAVNNMGWLKGFFMRQAAGIK